MQSAFAQSDTSTISGKVSDSENAAIPGATVTARNIFTGLERSVTTNDEGFYTINLLPPGIYTIIVPAYSGFAESRISEFALPVNTVAKLDFTLHPKVPNIGIEVTDADASTNTTGTNVSTDQFSNFPTVRTVQGLYTIATAVARSGLRDASGSERDPSVAGSSGPENNYILDGVNTTDSAFGGESPVLISESAVQEFQTANAIYSAEYGLGNSPGILNAVTKSGSNEFHGTALFYFRDDSLQAKGPFGGLSKPSLGQQQFGGSLGGPLKRDKAFFFVSADRLREKGAASAGVRDSLRRRVTPIFARTSLYKTLLTARFDFNRSDREYIFTRYTGDIGNGIDPGFSQGGKLQDPSNFQSRSGNQHHVMIGWMRTLSPSISNDVRISYIISNKHGTPLSSAPQVVFPSINTGGNFQADYHLLQRQFEIREDLTWGVGAHNLKFGLDYQHISLPSPANFNLFGTGIIFVPCDFPGEAGCASARVDTEIPVIFSLINRQTLTEGFSGFGTRGNLPPIQDDRLGIYGQDRFNVTPKLTLTLGLRWDYDNDFIGKRQENQARPRRRTTGKKNVQPRVGIVWRLTRITIRGGHGLFFSQSPLETRQLELLADGTRLPLVRAFGGALGSPFASVTANTPPDIFVTSNELRLPYTFQTSAGVEYELWKNSSLAVDFMTERGRRYPRRLEINRRSDGSRSDTRFGSVIETQSLVKTARDQLEVSFNMQSSPHLRFLRTLWLRSSYTLSRMLDEANDPLTFIETISNPVSSALDRAPSPFDARHRFNLSGNFFLPRGITVSSIVNARSSFPFEIIQNHDFSEGIGAGFFRLPTLGRNAGNRQVRTGADVNRAIDAFNADPNLVTAHGGPLAHVSPDLTFARPYFTFDLRVSKRFQFGETTTLELGGDAFNLFNHINVVGASATNPSGLENNVERSADFGKPLGVTPGGVFGPNAARAFQFFARLNF